MFNRHGKVSLAKFRPLSRVLTAFRSSLLSSCWTLTPVSLCSRYQYQELTPRTEESRGFGFVKLESVSEAEAAIEALNGTSIDGKTLTVAHVSIKSCYHQNQAHLPNRPDEDVPEPQLLADTRVSRSRLVDPEDTEVVVTVVATVSKHHTYN